MISAKGILFDFGGTLDTNGIHWGEFIWDSYIESGLEITKAHFREAYIHGERRLASTPIIAPQDSFYNLLKKKIHIQLTYIKENHHTSQHHNLAEEKHRAIVENCYEKVILNINNTKRTLDIFVNEFPMVLVTNFYGNMSTVLSEFNLSSYFHSIIESSIVKIVKPNPQLFALGIEALNLNANKIVVIGDSYKKDILPANSLGCHTIWLKNRCWEEEANTINGIPDITINKLQDIEPIIKFG